MKRALIVLGHGSRSAEATAQFLALVEMLAARYPDDRVLPACMQMADPTLASALGQAAGEGAEEILIIPCFLFQGIHVKADIPEMLAQLKVEYPQVAVRFGQPIGADPRLVDILCDRVEEMTCPV
ncbi:MAG: sirohydrochlorin chelatase [Armatimonadota bacterium]